jgi:2,3,4,5-tetrahydropyridine-2-carboxylate N-succinyltransferase
VLTATTPIYDVTGPSERLIKGMVPARSVVIPGMRPRKFPAGEYLTPCALIIGVRKESTDRKTSLNAALRDFGVSA